MGEEVWGGIDFVDMLFVYVHYSHLSSNEGVVVDNQKKKKQKSLHGTFSRARRFQPVFGGVFFLQTARRRNKKQKGQE